MTTTVSRPWQAFMATTAILIVGSLYALSALQALMTFGDHLGISEGLEQDLHVRADTVEQVYEHLSLAANVFTVLAVLYIVMAVMLYRGLYRPAVRLTATIFLVVSTLGMAADHFGVQDGIRDQVSLFRFLVILICLLLQAGLWFGPGRAWVRASTSA